MSFKLHHHEVSFPFTFNPLYRELLRNHHFGGDTPSLVLISILLMRYMVRPRSAGRQSLEKGIHSVGNYHSVLVPEHADYKWDMFYWRIMLSRMTVPCPLAALRDEWNRIKYCKNPNKRWGFRVLTVLARKSPYEPKIYCLLWVLVGLSEWPPENKATKNINTRIPLTFFKRPGSAFHIKSYLIHFIWYTDQ